MVENRAIVLCNLFSYVNQLLILYEQSIELSDFISIFSTCNKRFEYTRAIKNKLPFVKDDIFVIFRKKIDFCQKQKCHRSC